MKRLAIALLAVTGFSVGFASMASAADLPVKAPVMAPAYNWTGFYIGIEGGGGWGSTRHTNAVSGNNSGTDNNLTGGLVGGTYGYNWQFGSWVIGFEGDISWTGISDTFGINAFCGSSTPCITNLRWLGTDRARLGYAWDRYLVFATGGVAYGGVNAYIANNALNTSNETHTRAGYTVGGGIEAMLAPHWSAKLEYLYVNFGDNKNYTYIGVFNNGAAENVLVTSNIVRAGLNYKF
jgi:outer membrane immunogenic protein